MISKLVNRKWTKVYLCTVSKNKSFVEKFNTINTISRLHSTHFIYLFLKFCLFIHETHTERGRDIGKGRSRPPTGNLMGNSIPGPQDHDMSQRQTLNHWANQASLKLGYFPMKHSQSWANGSFCSKISRDFWESTLCCTPCFS